METPGGAAPRRAPKGNGRSRRRLLASGQTFVRCVGSVPSDHLDRGHRPAGGNLPEFESRRQLRDAPLYRVLDAGGERRVREALRSNGTGDAGYAPMSSHDSRCSRVSVYSNSRHFRHVTAAASSVAMPSISAR
jgi:hypothetical protein